MANWSSVYAVFAMLVVASSSPGASQAERVFFRTVGESSVAVDRVTASHGDTATIVWEPGSSTTIDLPDFIGPYTDAVFWAGNKLALIGDSYNGGSRLLIIDRDTAAVGDSFYARSPSFSASGRFIAFMRHYPRQLSEPSVVYLLYDLALNPAGNRMSAASEGDARWTAGRAIYPDWNRTSQSLDPLSTSSDYHLPNSPLAWSGDSWLFFIDSVQAHAFAVAIDAGSMTSRRIELNAAELVDPDGQGPGVDVPRLIRADSIEPLEVTTTSCRVRFHVKSSSMKVPVFEAVW